MQESDLVAVAALEALAHPAPWTAGNFRDALAAGYSTVVGEADGAIVAYGVLMMGAGEAQILNLTVASAARRRGLARALLRRFLNDAVERGGDRSLPRGGVRPRRASGRLLPRGGWCRRTRGCAGVAPRCAR